MHVVNHLSARFVATCFLVSLTCSTIGFAQFGDPFSAPQPAAKEPAGRKAPSAKQDKDESPSALSKQPTIEYPPTYVKFFLVDGDIVSGELNTNTLVISTEFGKLSVPIERIIRFEPGLNSYPDVIAQLNQLVEDLGSSKYDARQLAHKKLVELGPRIRIELSRYKDNGNAERKRHLEEIKKEIAAKIEEFDEEEMDDPQNQPWEKNDRLVTATFTAVGKIQQEQFKLKGKYGELNIKLSDIQRGSRPMGGKEPINKSLTVNQENFVQLKFKSPGLAVEKGDLVSVTAKGTITLSPWGSNAVSTPNGTPQYGTMPNTPGIPFGALVAKIGNGKYFLVGQKKKFRADAKGKLQFGITMNRSYVGKSYQFPGDYKLKIKIEPAPGDE